jgi:phosphate transport system permease protein
MDGKFKYWLASGAPYIWINAGAVSISIILVIGLLLLIATQGLSYFWPRTIAEFDYPGSGAGVVKIIGEIVDDENVPRARLAESGEKIPEDLTFVDRYLVKTGNRDYFGLDFRWVIGPMMGNTTYPADLMAVERREWGNLYGYLVRIKEGGAIMPIPNQEIWQAFQQYISTANTIFEEIRDIERNLIGAVNYKMEKLRLVEKRTELNGAGSDMNNTAVRTERNELQNEYEGYMKRLAALYEQMNHVSFIIRLSDDQEVEIPFSKVVRAYRPNAMSVTGKIDFYLGKLWEFMTDDPREANTEGGIFPAVFGTVVMVIIMAILVTPFGVIAAVYLREYARQGPFTRLVRIAVNNLAGVPSVVYGVFGLGFFVYFLGGNIDELFFSETLPTPTFGTPGLLWASLTLAILTVPVVIVATEEGLTRVPRSIREGSLALGATKAETLWHTVMPMTASAMITGLILAIARAAGEVAPLMLVGVVKLAPSLPVDDIFPYLHLDRKFMHLGFHIYDVGFQSPNVEAARPLVYATALLLVIIIIVLNLAAIRIRNTLRDRYRAAEQQ